MLSPEEENVTFFETVCEINYDNHKYNWATFLFYFNDVGVNVIDFGYSNSL